MIKKNEAKKNKIDNFKRSKREKSNVEKFIQFNDIFSYNLYFLYEIIIFSKYKLKYRWKKNLDFIYFKDKRIFHAKAMN